MSTATGASLAGQYVSFLLGGEEYAVSILRAREIIACSRVTRVPMTPGCVRGVMNLRGRVVPVVDLALEFGRPATELTQWTCALIVEVNLDGEPTPMGVLIDAATDVVELAAGDIEPPPSFGLQMHLDYLFGVGKAGNRFLLLLNIDRVLSTEALLSVAWTQTQKGLLPSGGTKPEAPGTSEP